VELAEKAPPAGAVESDWAVKLVPAPATPAPFVAVTEPVPVGDTAVKVYAPRVFPQPEPATAPYV
jgi:hypothetical protein